MLRPRPAVPAACVLLFLSTAPLAAAIWTASDESCRRTRVSFFESSAREFDVSAQVSIVFGSIPWIDEHEALLDGAQKGTRLPLGGADWSRLDTTCELKLEGVKVPAGLYDLALEKTRKGVALALLPAEKNRDSRIDPAHAEAAGRALLVPLLMEKAKKGPYKKVVIQLSREKTGNTIRLSIYGGIHRLGASMEVKAGRGTPFAMKEDRHRTTLTRGGDEKRGPEIVTVDHGLPAWNDSRASAIEEFPDGGLWRFGSDFWTTLETNVAIQLGPKKLSPGDYRLALKRTGEGWGLAVIATRKQRKKVADALLVDQVSPMFVVPLLAEQDADPAGELAVDLLPPGSDEGDARLRIRFGPHALGCSVGLPAGT